MDRLLLPCVPKCAMDVDRIFESFNAHQVNFLLIGGMNFLLRHQPVLTYDVDVWIEDTVENRERTEAALANLKAEWGPTEAEWRPVTEWERGWLARQGVYCLSSAAGAINVFRTVRGLDDWAECRRRACAGTTGAGTPYWGLCDADMLLCQTTLPETEQKQDRIRVLREAISRTSADG